MGRHDFTKTTRNITLSEDSRPKSQKVRIRDSYQIKIELHPSDKNLLLNAMKAELLYYNNLNENLGSRARTNPASIINFSEKWVRLFGQLAYEGININKLTNYGKGETIVPESLKSFSELLTGKDSQGKKYLSDQNSIILESAASRGNFSLLHPEVRKCMALEMVKFYQDQAKIISQAVPPSMRDDIVYRNAPSFLEALDGIRKRHVQLPRKAIDVRWDEKEENTVITVPYIKNPLIIENLNMSEPGWNLLMIHQTPGAMASQQTPWVVDFRKEFSTYLLKYIDQNSPFRGSAYHEARRDRYTG